MEVSHSPVPDRSSIHQPLLVNALGHCAGIVVFGILLYLFILDYSRSGRTRSRLSSVAAGLALLWNIGSLLALSNSVDSPQMDVIVALSFCVLSLLPAVLLHISVQERHRRVWIAGYLVSAVAIALHLSDFVSHSATPHRAALLLITAGFSALTLLTVLLDIRSATHAWSGSRLAAAMCLFLLAISFVHFGESHGAHAWSGEFALHHAGIPLALFVLLYDYRFLFLDAFLRFALNGALAAVAALACVAAETKFHVLERASQNPFDMALTFVAACLFLAGFAQSKWVAQRFITRVLFHRASLDPIVSALQDLSVSSRNQQDYLTGAFYQIANFFDSPIVAVKENPVEKEFRDLTVAAPLLEWSRWRPFSPAPGAEAALPIRFSSGDRVFLLLGARHGGRSYLSEDIAVLSRLGKTIEEEVERRRQNELQALAVQAELRALQAQINPHFLFNSLNTLYGTISRDNVEARRLVLNLADVFRYFLRSDRTFITVEEELKIVRAYLKIEELRLGPKLTTRIVVEDSTLATEIPVLSIQPLIENAVKHGAATSGEGFVSLNISEDSAGVMVEVSNSGNFLPGDAPKRGGAGVGMANVRRRLTLCYGHESELRVQSGEGTTLVAFSIPRRYCANELQESAQHS